eukprot:TRINITY_DN78771_c0_g1_i1.p1 TRINITY_DN78771_c0_g1~~TRINITY_DN78771_c0_g1_i1.p1  ORF type:complete len:217 (+),score=29.79 TRINITY_DN78771_c0_g1_i1:64-714(+)
MGAKCCKDMSMEIGTHTTGTTPEVQLRSARFHTRNDVPAQPTPLCPVEGFTDKGRHAEVLYDAGMAYDRGLKGYPKEPARALELLKTAAELGNADAQYRVGLYYDRGIVVSEDSKEAACWYLKAAEGGSLSAQFSLGICYSKGIGVGQDDAKALEWLQKAGERDCDLALSSLGYFYEVGVCCDRDLDRALEYYTKAATLGNVFACQRLSMFGRRVG